MFETYKVNRSSKREAVAYAIVTFQCGANRWSKQGAEAIRRVQFQIKGFNKVVIEIAKENNKWDDLIADFLLIELNEIMGHKEGAGYRRLVTLREGAELAKRNDGKPLESSELLKLAMKRDLFRFLLSPGLYHFYSMLDTECEEPLFVGDYRMSSTISTGNTAIKFYDYKREGEVYTVFMYRAGNKQDYSESLCFDLKGFYSTGKCLHNIGGKSFKAWVLKHDETPPNEWR